MNMKVGGCGAAAALPTAHSSTSRMAVVLKASCHTVMWNTALGFRSPISTLGAASAQNGRRLSAAAVLLCCCTRCPALPAGEGCHTGEVGVSLPAVSSPP